MKTAAITIIAVSAVFYAVKIIAPPGETQKMTGTVFTLVLILTVVSAVSGAKPEFPNIELNTEDTEVNQKAAEIIIGALLEQNGIEYRKIEIFADKTPDGGINITKVTVISDASPNEINKIITENTTAESVEVLNVGA